ncbi:hypothetical protein ACWF94_04555 [Streptomyces sp. NPDC055078]
MPAEQGVRRADVVVLLRLGEGEDSAEVDEAVRNRGLVLGGAQAFERCGGAPVIADAGGGSGFDRGDADA